MKVKFTMEWTEEIADEKLKEWAIEEGHLPEEEDSEEIDWDDIRTKWLEAAADAYAEDPSNIPADAYETIDYDVQQ